MSDGGYQRDLHLLSRISIPIYSAIAWTAPEVVNNKPQMEVMPATDIWDFGLCFLQMAFGLSILSEHQSPYYLIEELKLTKSLTALLRQVFQNDPKKRPSAWDLLHFEFFRNDDHLLEENRIFSSIPGEVAASDGKGLELHHFRRESTAAPQSRYAKEFVEDGRLGRGGFGEVFKARNKIDGQPYAIKKVKARSRSALDPVLSEVTVLSRLNHPNVVRYFAAWIDDGVAVDDRLSSESSGDETLSSLTNSGRRPVLPLSSRGLDFISSSNANIIFGNDPDQITVAVGYSPYESSEDEDAGHSSGSSVGQFEPDSDVGDGDPPTFEARSGSNFQGQAIWTVLYIQMEYCRPEVRSPLLTYYGARSHNKIKPSTEICTKSSEHQGITYKGHILRITPQENHIGRDLPLEDYIIRTTAPPINTVRFELLLR